MYFKDLNHVSKIDFRTEPEHLDLSGPIFLVKQARSCRIVEHESEPVTDFEKPLNLRIRYFLTIFT